MVKSTLYRSFVLGSCLLGATGAFAQFSFTSSNSLISAVSHSGNAVTVVDVNNDGLDDIVKMDGATTLVIDMQNQNGTFTHYNLGTVASGGRVWGMAVADVDNNGWKDVVTGNYGTLYLVKLAWSGSTITTTTTTLGGSYFVQNITFGDFDYDGWVDLAVCDDVDYMKIYKNTSGTLNLQAPTSAIINTNINAGMTYSGDPYDSGNYGSVWLDFDNDGDLDLYIAHCRQSTSSSTDQRRRDRLFVNDGTNHYTENSGFYGIETTNFRQTWTTSFGDIDNDGDLDVVMMNHTGASQILENDGTGHYTDITSTTGFNYNNDGIESTLEDFDNDGYLDILLSGGGSGDSYWVYHNNGNKTFTAMNSTFPSQSNGMLSFATGDLNHDGKVDVFASYGDVYNTPTSTNDFLYLNSTNNGNHYITFNLTGTVSNVNAIGARVTIHGAFGTQVREVRAGETYGTSNSMQLHFGLGANTSITDATVTWPSGVVTTFGALNADQFVTVVENTCTITDNVIPGPYAFCTGGSVTLNAASGYSSYLWSDGSTTQSVTATATGDYSVKVTSADGCTNISPNITTVLNPVETPTITTSGATSCEGVYTLTSSDAVSYAWTGPSGFTATTQSITPSVSGTYNLTTQGTCTTWNAAPETVNILASPNPVGTDASGPGPASYTLSATAASGTLSWYDMPSGGTLLTTGGSYTTPVLNSTTTYYVEESTSYPGSTYNVGPFSTGATISATTIDGGIDFDVLAPCTLTSVKVYGGTAGNREIQLKDNTGAVVNSMTVNIPADSMIVTLNFPLTVGTGYRLTTNATVNNANFGYASPALKRSTSGIAYPYNLSGYLTMTQGWTGSATSSSAYYYFYRWVVTGPSAVCTSNRVPVTATVTTLTGINEANNNGGIASVYPNPATENITISLDKSVTGKVQVNVIDLSGRLVAQQIFNASDKLNMSLNGLAKGTYMVRVITDNAQSVQRIVKN